MQRSMKDFQQDKTGETISLLLPYFLGEREMDKMFLPLQGPLYNKSDDNWKEAEWKWNWERKQKHCCNFFIMERRERVRINRNVLLKKSKRTSGLLINPNF